MDDRAVRGVAAWWRAGCGLAGLLGAYLLVSGLIRLVGDGAAGGPLGRLLVGLVLTSAAVAVYAVSRRRPEQPAEEPTAAKVDAGAETVTCPVCGAVNAPSARACHTCGEALR